MVGLAPEFQMLLAAATTAALGVFSIMGIPYTQEALGGLIFLSAFPLVWLNERRKARMLQLMIKANKKLQFVSSGNIDAQREGSLVFMSGPLSAILPSPLSLPEWGVEAPPLSAGLRVTAERFGPLDECSPYGLCCQRGQWDDASREFECIEHKAMQVCVGAFRLGATPLERLDTWEVFSPKETEGFARVLCRGEPAEKEAVSGIRGVLGGLLTRDAPAPKNPFSGSRPLMHDGSLHYPRGRGTPDLPAFGDIRVRFWHLPCGPAQLYTAVGVQRGSQLEAFRYLQPPPSGLQHGPVTTDAFNVGSVKDTDLEPGPALPPGDALHAYKPVPSTDCEDELLEGKRPTPDDPKPDWLPGFLRAVMKMLVVATETWRWVLHRTVPEELPCLASGQRTRCVFFLKAEWEEIKITWQIRLAGLFLMMVGFNITFWKWYALLLLVPGGMFAAYGMVSTSAIGSCGFIAVTCAAASLMYRPVTAVLYLACGISLFCALFGVTQLLWSLLSVTLCMFSIALLFAAHLSCPW